MEWFKEHLLVTLGSTGAIGLLLISLQRIGALGAMFRGIRDSLRNDAQKQIAQLKATLRARLLEDDARDEIHAQDVSEKKEMCAQIEALKRRCRENGIKFDDLL